MNNNECASSQSRVLKVRRQRSDIDTMNHVEQHGLQKVLNKKVCWTIFFVMFQVVVRVVQNFLTLRNVCIAAYLLKIWWRSMLIS